MRSCCCCWLNLLLIEEKFLRGRDVIWSSPESVVINRRTCATPDSDSEHEHREVRVPDQRPPQHEQQVAGARSGSWPGACALLAHANQCNNWPGFSLLASSAIYRSHLCAIGEQNLTLLETWITWFALESLHQRDQELFNQSLFTEERRHRLSSKKKFARCQISSRSIDVGRQVYTFATTRG